MAVGTVRTSHMRVFWDAIERLPQADALAIRSAIRPEHLEPVVRGIAPPWVPATWNVDWVRAVAKQLDSERFGQFFRAMTRRDFETSVFKSFVAGTVRLSGMNVGIVIKRIPTGFSLMWRDVGDVEVHGLRGMGCELTMTSVAPELIDQHWLDSFRFGVVGIFDVLERPASVVLRDLDVRGRTATFALDWSHSGAR